MAFTYKPLWKLLIDEDMTKKELSEKVKVSKSTLDKMGRNENVSLDVLDKICSFFGCRIEDVIEYKSIEVEK